MRIEGPRLVAGIRIQRRRAKPIVFAVVLGLVSTATQTQPSPAQAEPRPAFESYAVEPTFSGTPAAVDLESHPRARQMRTRLRDGAKEGPNFAGHYTVVTWGCGTSCRESAIVDAVTGRVLWGPPFATELQFRLDSRLLVAEPREAILGYYEGRCPEAKGALSTVTAFWVLEEGELQSIASIENCPLPVDTGSE